MYANRIEFVSIGELLSGVTIDNIMLNMSVYRNPKLAAVFYRLKLIEAHGTRMPKIMKAYENSTAKPKNEVTNNAFKITLPNRNYVAPAAAVNSPEEKILAYLNEHDPLVGSEANARLGISQATSSRILKSMVSDGLLYPEGSGWKIRYRKK